MFQIPLRIPRDGGGEQNGRVNLALRAGLTLSNPESVRADARRLSSWMPRPQQLHLLHPFTEMLRGDYTVTRRCGRESAHMIREFKG